MYFGRRGRLRSSWEGGRPFWPGWSGLFRPTGHDPRVSWLGVGRRVVVRPLTVPEVSGPGLLKPTKAEGVGWRWAGGV